MAIRVINESRSPIYSKFYLPEGGRLAGAEVGLGHIVELCWFVVDLLYDKLHNKSSTNGITSGV